MLQRQRGGKWEGSAAAGEKNGRRGGVGANGGEEGRKERPSLGDGRRRGGLASVNAPSSSAS